jgi:hypothetical protein
VSEYLIIHHKGEESPEAGLPVSPDRFIPKFDDTELEREFGLPHSCPWTLFKRNVLDVFYHLDYINFDYSDTYRGLRIVSSRFADLCEEFDVNFEFIPVNIKLRQRGVDISPEKEYGLFFLKDPDVYALDFEHSQFCIKRGENGKARLNPEIPYRHELRYVYDYKVDAKKVAGKSLFRLAERVPGVPRAWNICSNSFSKKFAEKNLSGAEFFGLEYPWGGNSKLWNDIELDPRCRILDKGEKEVFFQPARPRPPRPKLP